MRGTNYDENHEITEVPVMKRNQDLIYVDTSVLIKAPKCLFIAGMGDAFTKRYEVRQAADNTRQRNTSAACRQRCQPLWRNAAIRCFWSTGPRLCVLWNQV